MRLQTIKILGVQLTTSPKSIILEEIQKGFNSWGKNTVKQGKNTLKTMMIVTPNPEIIMIAQSNKAFLNILNQADVALPDGIGSILAAKILAKKYPDMGYGNLRSRIPGVEFLEEVVVMAAQYRVSIGLIGGTAGVALKTLECLQFRHPGVSGWALDLPYISVSDLQSAVERDKGINNYVLDSPINKIIQSIVQKIHSDPVGVVCIALGAPKQELFMTLLQRALHVTEQSVEYKTPSIVFMGVGGSFDMISGKIRRAPYWIRTIGFEWVWRLLWEPWRLQRQLVLIRFIDAVFRSF